MPQGVGVPMVAGCLRAGRLRPLAVAMLVGLTPVPPGHAADAAPLRLVTFGTSLTASRGWQGALRDRLAECLGRPVTVSVVARNGAASDWGLAHVGEVLAASPDVVLVEFASNDAALNRLMPPWTSRAAMGAILTRLMAGPTHPRVYVMAMNPMFGLKAANRPFLRAYTDMHLRLALRLGAGTIDHRPGWAALGGEARRSIPDGSHPRDEVAARVMVPTIVGAVAQPGCQGR